MPARLQVTLGAAVLFVVGLLAGCEGDYRPRAIGKEGEITVVMDSSHWTGAAGQAFRKSVAPWVETLPQPERYFELRHLELSSERTYESVQDLKNVVIVAPLSDTTNEASFLRRRFSEDARTAILDGQNAVVHKPNLWRRSQRVFFVTAGDSSGLVDALWEQGPAIRDTMKAVTLQRMKRDMYDDARQYALEDSLLQRHGFAVNMQHDFRIAIDTTTATGGFVWLRRLLPETRREFFVYYKENASPSRLTPEWIHATHDSLTRRYMRGNVTGFVRIDDRRPLTMDQTTVLDRYGYVSRGLWHMVTPAEDGDGFRGVGGGGPFITYAFYDRPSDRIYLLHGSVFAPGFEKLRFLRQMEVMATTFRTHSEQEAANSQSTAAVE